MVCGVLQFLGLAEIVDSVGVELVLLEDTVDLVVEDHLLRQLCRGDSEQVGVLSQRVFQGR